MKETWGKTPDGEPIERYTIRNKKGMSARILNFGAVLAELTVPTTQSSVNVVLGYSSANDYLQDQHYLGVVAGRYCNRIADATIQLGDQSHSLTANEGKNQLHGGDGFGKRLWSCQSLSESSLTLSLVSADGDQGFPGQLEVCVTYKLTDANELIFEWSAQTDKDTVVSLTNHAYFNLDGSADIAHHHIAIPLEYITPVRADGIPTGIVENVDQTIWDLRNKQALTNIIKSESLAATQGFDHNWCKFPAADWDASETLVAYVGSDASGLNLAVSSTLPGVQFYTGNYLDESGDFTRHQGLCLETQFYPNAPNVAGFPSPLLKAGQRTTHRTRYAFSNS